MPGVNSLRLEGTWPTGLTCLLAKRVTLLLEARLLSVVAAARRHGTFKVVAGLSAEVERCRRSLIGHVKPSSTAQLSVEPVDSTEDPITTFVDRSVDRSMKKADVQCKRWTDLEKWLPE